MEETEGRTALRLISSRGPVETGLLDELAAFYSRQTGGLVQISAAASSASALDAGRRGDADLLLVETADVDNAFFDEGYGLARVALIASDFLLVGPPDDPAGVSTLPTMLAVFRRIAAARAPFLSAPDGSLARRKEQEIWAVAGVTPQVPWRRTAAPDSTSADLLRAALASGCYALCDRITVVTAPGEVPVLFEGDPMLRNDLALIPLNPERVPGTRFDLAAAFTTWASNWEVQQAIGAYGQEQYGAPLYLPLARYEWRPAARPTEAR